MGRCHVARRFIAGRWDVATDMRLGGLRCRIVTIDAPGGGRWNVRRFAGRWDVATYVGSADGTPGGGRCRIVTIDAPIRQRRPVRPGINAGPTAPRTPGHKCDSSTAPRTPGHKCGSNGAPITPGHKCPGYKGANRAADASSSAADAAAPPPRPVCRVPEETHRQRRCQCQQAVRRDQGARLPGVQRPRARLCRDLASAAAQSPPRSVSKRNRASRPKSIGRASAQSSTTVASTGCMPF